MELSPGIVYLIQRLPYILTPPVATYICTLILSAYWNITLSSWVLVSALILSLPAALSVAVLWSDFLIYRDAKAHGATLPPRIPDPSPGGFMSLLKAIRESKTRYPGTKSGYDALQIFMPVLPGDVLIELNNKLGGHTFNNRVLFQNKIITSEPEHIKMILATQFDNFEKGPEMRHIFHSLLGTGVFASDGELWKFHRSISRPFFSRDRISHFDIFNRHAEDAINQLKTRLQEGYPVDFQDMVSRFTLDSATEFLFGNDFNSLSAGLPYPHYSPLCNSSSSSAHPATQFAQAFSEAQSVTAKRSRFGYHWPLMEFWHDKIKKPMSIVYSFINPIVTEAIVRKRKRGTKNADKINDDETLLEHLVNSTEDPIILRDEIMSLLVAGRDTTASTLTFTVYMLAEHPEVLTKLRQEIMEKIGPSRRPDYEDFRSMKYLRAVINETLRLYPVVPFNSRTSIKATLLPSNNPGKKPIYIPANTRVAYSTLSMHRRKDLWGESALEFDPDRFIDDRLQTYLTPNPFIFLPFNAGPRICLGQQFAYNEVSFFLVCLLQKFSAISLATDAQPLESRAPESWANGEGRQGREKIRPKTHLTMYVQDGLWVTMKEASYTKDV